MLTAHSSDSLGSHLASAFVRWLSMYAFVELSGYTLSIYNFCLIVKHWRFCFCLEIPRLVFYFMLLMVKLWCFCLLLWLTHSTFHFGLKTWHLLVGASVVVSAGSILFQFSFTPIRDSLVVSVGPILVWGWFEIVIPSSLGFGYCWSKLICFGLYVVCENHRWFH